MADMTTFFKDITLQQPLVAQMQQELTAQTLSHAYLLSGPPGTGKKSLALRFGFAILAQSDPNAALFFKEQHHPDLLVLSRPENKTVLTKTQITDELIPWLGYKPYQAQSKVAILYDAHSLSPEGANALLKTLEEPPAYAVLLLVSDQENILETIRSRCRILSFPPISSEELLALLKQKGCEGQKAQEIAGISRGDASLALHFLQEDLEVLQRQAIQLLEELQTGSHSAVFQLAQALEAKGKPLFNLLWMLLRDGCIEAETGNSSLRLLSGAAVSFSAPLVSREKLLENGARIQRLWSYCDSHINALGLYVNIAWAFYHCFEL